MSGWFLTVPLAGLGWWLLGFPPGWGWLVVPLVPAMPVSVGGVIVLATVVFGAYAGLVWLRSTL